MSENEKQKRKTNSIDSPTIFDKDRRAILEQLKEMVSFYTPEWRFSEEKPDPGSTLFLIVAAMLQENIKRLNRVPLKNYIAFLNLLNSRLSPAKPATAYVKFNVVDGYRQAVFIPAGTKLVAEVDERSILFETEGSLLVSPARLSAAFQADASVDSIIPCYIPESASGTQSSAPIKFPLRLFDFSQGENVQEHALYIAHEDLLNIRGTAAIYLSIKNIAGRYTEKNMYERLTDSEAVEWLYATSEGWSSFDEVRLDGNEIGLWKKKQKEFIKIEVNGILSHWIKCRVKSIAKLKEESIQISDIHMKARHVDLEKVGGNSPDQLFQDDLELDQVGFYPFGKVFASYSMFYLASQETFSKKTGKVTLTFNLTFHESRLYPEIEPYIEWKLWMKKSAFHRPEYPPICISEVAWEYWNGRSWVNLDVMEESKLLFNGSFQAEQKVTFICPDDFEKVFVNSHSNYWIRARIVHIDHLFSSDPVYLSPWLENVRLTYDYEDTYLPIQACVTNNNLEYKNVTSTLKSSGAVFQPFYRWEQSHQALYLGFDQALVKGPISLYFSLQNQTHPLDGMGTIDWEYLVLSKGKQSWLPLKVLDDTFHFTRSGTIQFFGPEDVRKVPLFGQDLYWIRAVYQKSELETQTKKSVFFPRINDLYLNGIKVIQKEKVMQEIPSRLGSEEAYEYQLEGQNMMNEEVWIEETGYIHQDELNQLSEADPMQIQTLEDSEGNLQKVWVKWRPVLYFHESHPTDRHYMINHHSGRIRFGDGKKGRIPPITSEKQIKVTYSTVRGLSGNVDAFQINALQSSIPYIQSVYNPEPASGGSDPERLEHALSRAPQKLKHRQRAVTVEDFEQLVKEAYPHIVKVKCLANRNVNMEKEVGCMTIVVLQRGGRKDSTIFAEYKQQIEGFLLEQVANVIAFPQNIQVIEPVFLEVSVHAVLVVDSMNDIIPTEWEANQRLSHYLNPVSGHDEKGWEIGEPIHPSVFYPLFSSIRSVSYIESCFLNIIKEEAGKRTEIQSEQVGQFPHGVICNGKHVITVKV